MRWVVFVYHARHGASEGLLRVVSRFQNEGNDYSEPTPDHRSFVRMLISEVSVRCTGHLLAISSRRERCSAVKGPSNRTSRSFLSRIPSFCSHSHHSTPYYFECLPQP